MKIALKKYLRQNLNVPNILSSIRMLMIPLYLVLFVRGAKYPALIVFLAASLTDLLDGMIARRYHQITDFGKLMDPIADKLLTASAVIMLTASGTVHPIATFITIGREFVISGFRLVSASKGNVIAAGKVGKIKTVMQCVAVMLILIGMPLQGTSPLAFLLTAGRVALWISVALSIWSAVEYIVKNKGAVTSM